MCPDEKNTLAPTPCLYLIPIKSYREKRIYIDLMTSSFDLSWPNKRLLIKIAPGMSSLVLFIILSDLKISD